MATKTPLQIEELAKLDQLIKEKFDRYLSQPDIMQFLIQFAGADKRPYATFLTQVYHYTFHTARNQALVGVNLSNTHIKYMKFCFEHALEETGHELMALHDLKAMGLPINDVESDMPPILPATELLVSYLYWVSIQGNPIQRLGFSYWAERSYGVVGQVVESMAETLKLDKKQMTFYFNHSDIDDKHAKDVENILIITCKTKEDWKAVNKVASTTIDVSLEMMSQCIEAYKTLASGEESDLSILNAIAPNPIAANA